MACRSVSLAPPWAEDLSAYVADEVMVKARDGTLVPLSIVHRKDLVRDGKAPLWLTGYGAYGISIKPTLAAGRFALLEDGGVYAVCHVRGGGEFGEDWHRAGMMATKPNTYRDLIDCAEYLHAHGYGSPQTTAIEGRSAGGITVGMALAERPDLFRVVFSGVGDSNALRAEFETDGDGERARIWQRENRSGLSRAGRRRCAVACERRHGLSGRALHHRAERSTGGALATGQDGGAASGRDVQRAARAAVGRSGCRPRHGFHQVAARSGNRRSDGVSLLANGKAGLPAGALSREFLTLSSYRR